MASKSNNEGSGSSSGSNSGSGASPSQGDVFDVRKVRRLVELMNDHDLAEIDLRQGKQRIRLRRGGEPVAMAAVPAAPVAAVAAPAGGTTPAEPAGTTGPAEPTGEVIKSPMVGTFYPSANPESAAYVSVGDQIGPETTICIIEAMKVFNEIPAECSGKIAAVLAEAGAAVEFGQPLFRLE